MVFGFILIIFVIVWVLLMVLVMQLLLIIFILLVFFIVTIDFNLIPHDLPIVLTRSHLLLLLIFFIVIVILIFFMNHVLLLGLLLSEQLLLIPALHHLVLFLFARLLLHHGLEVSVPIFREVRCCLVQPVIVVSRHKQVSLLVCQMLVRVHSSLPQDCHILLEFLNLLEIVDEGLRNLFD